MLLGLRDVAPGSTVAGPHQTATTQSTFVASVPSTSPTAYETITLYQETTAGGTATLALDEVIGDVDSARFARQLLSMLDADINASNCNPNGSDSVMLPGTNPPVTAVLSGGQASNGSVRSERLFASQGSRLLCLTWTSGTTINPSGAYEAPSLPALPNGSAMAQVLNTALALIPS
jgi:hypothetical protein